MKSLRTKTFLKYNTIQLQFAALNSFRAATHCLKKNKINLVLYSGVSNKPTRPGKHTSAKIETRNSIKISLYLKRMERNI